MPGPSWRQPPCAVNVWFDFMTSVLNTVLSVLPVMLYEPARREAVRSSEDVLDVLSSELFAPAQPAARAEIEAKAIAVKKNFMGLPYVLPPVPEQRVGCALLGTMWVCCPHTLRVF